MSVSELSNASCVYLTNVLNEVLYGLPEGCERVLETTKDQLSHLFQKLAAACRQGGVANASLSVGETQCLLNCSKLCIEQIDEDEFSTRLGESTETARAVNQQLMHLIEGGSSSI